LAAHGRQQRTLSIEENLKHQDTVTPHRLSIPPLTTESQKTAMQKLSMCGTPLLGDEDWYQRYLTARTRMAKNGAY
jgi:hypothetical protein